MDEERRKEQDTRLINRNAKAAMVALDQQNKKLFEFQLQINSIAAQLSQLNVLYNQMKDEKMSELIAQMGTGPTVTE